uniref:CS domain-containing protein n=1 Tax=Timema cristinae TaxID=61476 RepID=A0A7R9H3T5_TIMCR|nr:unnamed protein product [Timema cristinae]
MEPVSHRMYHHRRIHILRQHNRRLYHPHHNFSQALHKSDFIFGSYYTFINTNLLKWNLGVLNYFICMVYKRLAFCMDHILVLHLMKKQGNGYDSKTQQASDCYNGAVRDGYRWSQSITDLDVQVIVPCDIKKGKNVHVDVKASSLSVSVLDSGQWSTLLAGELSWKVNKEESVWTLVPGNEINIHLEKSQERWWDSLLVSEPKIDLKHIDACRPMDDLPQEEQMKIQELMWNEERKRLGLPTSEQLATEKILKEAWNKDGSPFKNLDYDPTLVNFGNS